MPRTLLALLVVGLLAAPTFAFTWDSVPMAGGDNPDSFRSWLMTDPVTGDVFYSKWNGDYNVYRLGAAEAVNYGVTAPGDWTTYAQPLAGDGSPLYIGNDDSGTNFNIYNGFLYASTSHKERENAGNPFQRQFVRLDIAGTGEGAWTTQYRDGDGANFAGFAYEDPTQPGDIRITAKWTGWRPFVTYDVTSQSGADFSYAEVDKQFNSPGYWGSDAVVGDDGYAYFIEPGENGTAYQFRRGSLTSAATNADLAAPWVDIAAFPVNNHHNRRTNTAIEFIPAGVAPSGADELWVMPMNLDGTQTDKIYRFAAADGSALGDLDLPFTLANSLGHGYDMAYADGYLFVMEGAGNENLWSVAVPEPATLALLAVGGLALIRRRR